MLCINIAPAKILEMAFTTSSKLYSVTTAVPVERRTSLFNWYGTGERTQSNP